MDELGVTIYCLVYNHEHYLKKCLDSLIHQKTNFKYSIIVHDDASTDRSAEIIRKYAEDYPDIIVPIYQKENQYKKGSGIIVRNYIEPLAKGKYIAICEGDDYWLSADKLQRQFDIMEKNPTCGICLHRTVEIKENGEMTNIEYPAPVYTTGIITPKQLFQTMTPRMYHTSSFFIRGALWHEYIKNPPAYKKSSNVGDVPLILYFGSKYGIYQINEVMSAYRRGAPSGWSNQRHRANTDYLIKFNTSITNTFLLFDRETNKEYHSMCAERISRSMYPEKVLSESLKEYLKPENKEYLAFYSPVKRLSIYAGMVFPKTVKKVYLNRYKKATDKRRERWRH